MNLSFILSLKIKNDKNYKLIKNNKDQKRSKIKSRQPLTDDLPSLLLQKSFRNYNKAFITINWTLTLHNEFNNVLLCNRKKLLSLQ